jgi:ammonia channel protein AmtB
VFIAGVLVFFMQAGFALVEAGLTRAKNVVNIFAKNMADAIVGILAFFAVGYAFAFGGGDGWFIGTEKASSSTGLDMFGDRRRRRPEPRPRRSSSRRSSPPRRSRSPPERWPNAPSSRPT